MGVVRDGPGRRIAARLRDKAARNRDAEAAKRDAMRKYRDSGTINVYVDPPKPPPPRVIIVRDPRNPRAGWGAQW